MRWLLDTPKNTDISSSACSPAASEYEESLRFRCIAVSRYLPAGVTSVCPSSTDKVPHFSRLGDVEVNAGQNASFQCVATGKVSESEPFLLEVRTHRLFMSPSPKRRLGGGEVEGGRGAERSREGRQRVSQCLSLQK